MTDEAITIMAKAIYEDRNGHGCKPWSRHGSTHKEPYLSDAKAALEALRAAGYWVERWRPIEEAPRDGENVVAVIAGTHPQSGKAFVPEVVEWCDGEWWNEMWGVCNSKNTYLPTHFTALPPPPVQTEGGGG